MVVIVCGSREWPSWTAANVITSRIEALPHDVTIRHGCCRGADSIADGVARRLGLRVRTYPANWSKLGAAAGPMRNSAMLNDSPSPELVIAFRASGESRGTDNMIKQARKRGITVEVIDEYGRIDVRKDEQPGCLDRAVQG